MKGNDKKKERKIEKVIKIINFSNKYNHMINNSAFRTLPFPALMSLLVLFSFGFRWLNILLLVLGRGENVSPETSTVDRRPLRY